MKYLFLVLSLFVITSCSDNDDTLINFNLTDAIEGSWSVSNPIGVAIEDDVVIFNDDNTGMGAEKGSFYEESMDSSSYSFTWSQRGFDSILVVNYDNGITKNFSILKLTEDQMILDASIANWTLNR